MRVPLLGIAIAMSLLVVENLGALAYRDYKLASLAADVASATHAASATVQTKRSAAVQSPLKAAVSSACGSSRPSSRR